MSQSSLLKNVPDLFRQENLEKAWVLLRQPTSLAVIASLGVHGLLWFGLPLVSSSEQKPPDAERTVQVVELSPLEQSRLPQSPLAQALTPLPGPMPPKPTDPLGMGDTSGATPSDATPYYNIPLDPTASSGATSTESAASKRSDPKTTDESNQPDQTTSDSKDTKDAEPETSDTGDSEESDTSPSPKASDPEGAKSPEDLARVQQNEQEKLRSLFAYNSEDPGTKETGVLKQLEEFSAATGISLDDLSKAKNSERNISIPLPEKACPFKDEIGEAIKRGVGIGAIVQPDGKLSKVVLLQSSGSKGLNEAAMEHVKNQKQKFDLNGKSNFLGFRVSFDPTKTDCTATDPSKPAS
ncbi:MAG: hypothetical protein HC866_01680 [Leptolyngbyaceae cyanobacterium RU_5_1]|nr:hypothetical protein [Leptolyngbyaceae cyanobacterium RU_5_1]